MPRNAFFAREGAIPQRLLMRLDALHLRRVAIVSAPGGYNKTNLIRAWLAADPTRSASSSAPIIRRDATSFDVAPLRDHLNSLEPSAPHYIFIDNHDHITDAQSLNDLLDLIEHFPQARLILAGRTRPAIPLTGLQMRSHLVELTADELAYTEQEALGLLTNNGLTNDDSVSTVWEQFGGWPIIYELLANMPITWGNQGHLRTVIDGYLEEEVLAGLADEDRQFLEGAAVLPDVTPASAAYVTGHADSAERMRRLAALGIPFRYLPNSAVEFSPGFRDYLHRCIKLDPERSAQMNRQAANWLQHQGQPDAALEHAIESQDTALMYDLVITDLTTNLYRAAETPLLLDRYASRLPVNHLMQMLRLVTMGLTQPESGQVHAIREIISHLPEAVPARDWCRIWAGTLFLSRCDNWRTELDLLERALTFAREQSQDPDPTINPSERAHLLTELGMYEAYQGNIQQAIYALQQGTSAARVAGVNWHVGMTLGTLALLMSHDGSASVARRFAEEAVLIFDSEGISDMTVLMPAILALATVEWDQGNTAGAHSQLARLNRIAGIETPGVELFRHIAEAEADFLAGDARGALRQIEQARLDLTPHSSAYVRFLAASVAFNAQLALNQMGLAEAELDLCRALNLPEELTAIPTLEARLALARGNADTAYARLHDLVSSGTHMVRRTQQLQLLIIYGMAASESGHSQEALDCFQRAGVLAERLGVNKPGARHTRMASSIKQDDPGLTPSEEGVLRELSTDKPLAEIAAALFISQNTLKTHLRRIYKKLGAAGRAEAVKKARSLGMRLD